MCGRFTFRPTVEQEAEYLAMMGRSAAPLKPRYNIAPTQDVLVVRLNEEGKREAVMMRWGLLPVWIKSLGEGAKFINARAETITEKPTFKKPFRERRCLVVADGFFEWMKEGKAKQPYLIERTDHQPFVFAGIWTRSKIGGEEYTSCSIVTTAADAFMEQIHDRRPIILPTKDYDDWLGGEPDTAEKLLTHGTMHGMQMIAVNPVVNNARNSGPDCVEPLPNAKSIEADK